MRILQVITTLQFGGAEKLISEIAPLLRDKGNQVDVCSFVATEPNLNKVLEAQGINVINFATGGSVYNPLFVWKLVKLMKKYDVIHTHNTACQMFAAIGSIFCNTKLVTTEHSTSNHRRDLKLFKVIDRWMYNRYKTVICISDKTQENLQSYLGKTKVELIVINNGIEVEKYRNAKPLTANEKSTDKFVVTMVAGFRYQKDHETVIKAFSHLDTEKYELWFVGDGERRKEIEGCTRKYNLSNVRLWGVRNDVPSILMSSDVVIQSSHIEGFGLAAAEGMAVGKPVIATAIPGLAQVVGGYGILFPHEDDKTLAAKIQKLAENKLYYNEIASQCSKRAEDFDIQIMVESYKKIYEKIINEK